MNIMMPRWLPTLLTTLILCPAQSALSHDYYVGVYGGIVFFDRSDDCLGAVGGAKIGRNINRFRVEAEFSYLNSDEGNAFFSKNIDLYTIMLNSFVDFHTTSMIRPYVGAGLGFAHSEATINTLFTSEINSNSTDFAIQLMAGARIFIKESWSIEPQIKAYARSGENSEMIFESTIAFNFHF